TPSSFCEEFWVVDHNGVGGGDSGCWDRHGGSGFSSHPGSLDIEFGYGGLPGSDTGSYFESDGFVSSEVARLEARLDTADVQEIPLMPGPAGTDMSIYVFFAPLGATGTVVAYDENGNIVQTQPFCATAPAGESGSEGSSFGG